MALGPWISRALTRPLEFQGVLAVLSVVVRLVILLLAYGLIIILGVAATWLRRMKVCFVNDARWRCNSVCRWKCQLVPIGKPHWALGFPNPWQGPWSSRACLLFYLLLFSYSTSPGPPAWSSSLVSQVHECDAWRCASRTTLSGGVTRFVGENFSWFRLANYINISSWHWALGFPGR